jgi:hypothetical protein
VGWTLMLESEVVAGLAEVTGEPMLGLHLLL